MPAYLKYADSTTPFFKVKFTTNNGMPYEYGWIYLVWPAELELYGNSNDFEVLVTDTPNPDSANLSKVSLSSIKCCTNF